ncbi:MAG: T9SS type A sorting domain-containing protein [Chitinophagales bacterium]|nr:T9SS type A sorting domain-containing protein [Chitinophagales bacterium]MCB9030892.1 T9SS type A sorting domain-containing protein [Chitinophagales bacterium]HAE12674.1 hypothetical protein [Bacteroidota bacterium]HQU39220.1 T9SS type A sorting domain-containing protein [Chitinophagales bacterium]HRX22832.1 T9SS type A sorting domain-containing protein [Chitinophagales bacterium]
MKRLQLLTLAALATMGTQAQIVVTDADLVAGGTYTWTTGNTYLLDGFVFLEDGGSLTIQPGVIIKGKETPSSDDLASTLIICQGATIQADGTAEQPIIFTSELDDLSVANDLSYNDRGLWGGVIILGYAQIGNATETAAIEGIPTEDPRGTYGGNNDADNSGYMHYCSIRHGGAEIGAGNEINGLTLGGVGSGTNFEHIEVYANLDDGIEFFGGSPNCKWMAMAFCGDDSYDWDQGFRGKGQFWFAVQDAASGDCGGEWDGATPDGASPYSNPTIYNATFIGAGTDGSAENGTAMLMRDATGGTVANSIFTSFVNHAIEVEDLPSASGVDSRQRLEDGDLSILNNIYFDFGTGNDFVAGELIRATTDAEDPTCGWLISHLTSNNNTSEDPELGAISRIPDNGLDPRPSSDGPAYTGVMATEPADAFFSDVDYKGAFEANGPMWLEGWTALSANNHLVVPVAIQETDLISQISMFPNPVSSAALISLNLENSASLTISIVDMQGRVVNQIATGQFFAAGQHTVTVNTEALAASQYMLNISNVNGQVATISFVK